MNCTGSNSGSNSQVDNVRDNSVKIAAFLNVAFLLLAVPNKKTSLKCGLEIHQQLAGKKLFCNCPTLIKGGKPDFIIKRKLRAVAGEYGEIDISASYEQIKDKTFVYQGDDDAACLVETDSEPPRPINQEALQASLQFSLLVNASISPVIQVMRKTIVDGSNTSGFQRTALIAREGFIETSSGKVKINNINLEEDACRIVSETASEKTYRLDRLGIPLIEIGTAPEIASPEQGKEVAEKLGLILRSLPQIKRGLGTIRQDVNVSIKGGTRVEIKGAQDLRQLPLLIELEVKRQQELLKIKKELKEIKLPAKSATLKINDLTSLLRKSSSRIISDTVKGQGKVMGLKLSGLAGFLGREVQPGKRFGTECAGWAKMRTGVGGIFHSEELPGYGITKQDVTAIKKNLHCNSKDAFVLVVGEVRRSIVALEAVSERIEAAKLGVPAEVRRAHADGTTSFLRLMPGAARMYPETDVPLLFPEIRNIQLPELLEDKVKRYQQKDGLSSDLALLIAKSDWRELFEELLEKHPKIKPAFIAETLTSTPREIRRKYNLDSSVLTSTNFRELFTCLAEDKLHKDIILDVLIDMIKGTFSLDRYTALSIEDLHQKLTTIVKENSTAPFSALMGIAMKTLSGQASGRTIAEELRKILKEGHA